MKMKKHIFFAFFFGFRLVEFQYSNYIDNTVYISAK